MSVHYLEIVSNDADTLAQLYQRMHGLSFGPPDPDLGQARVAARPDGTLVGIRKPLAAHEQPIMRTYLAVEDTPTSSKEGRGARRDRCLSANPTRAAGDLRNCDSRRRAAWTLATLSPPPNKPHSAPLTARPALLNVPSGAAPGLTHATHHPLDPGSRPVRPLFSPARPPLKDLSGIAGAWFISRDARSGTLPRSVRHDLTIARRRL